VAGAAFSAGLASIVGCYQQPLHVVCARRSVLAQMRQHCGWKFLDIGLRAILDGLVEKEAQGGRVLLSRW
jgi:hypothetical protein